MFAIKQITRRIFLVIGVVLTTSACAISVSDMLACSSSDYCAILSNDKQSIAFNDPGGTTLYTFSIEGDSIFLDSEDLHLQREGKSLPKWHGKYTPRVKVFGTEVIVTTSRLCEEILWLNLSENSLRKRMSWNNNAAPFVEITE
jgi:hypothetical protein